MANIQVNIGALSLSNPVMTASGTFGYGIEYADFMDLASIGGVIVKGTTLQPREGNDCPLFGKTKDSKLPLHHSRAFTRHRALPRPQIVRNG